MKNLLTFVAPEKHFIGSYENLMRFQIDNSYDLGWRKDDIIVMTNFEYEYNGIKSIVIGDEGFCSVKNRPCSTKTTVVSYLLENGLLKDDEIYWAHDLECYQNYLIEDSELGLDDYDVGFTTYGWSEKWCLGSYFFKLSSKNIFKAITDTIYEIQNEDERALVKLTRENKDNINDRIKKLNITYQIGMRNVEHNYDLATKPLKVVHFFPYYMDKNMPDIPLNTFMYGKNKLGIPLMSERLIKLFRSYGIQETEKGVFRNKDFMSLKELKNSQNIR